MSLYDQFMYGVLVLKVYRRLGCMQISTEIHGTFIGPPVWRYRSVVDSCCVLRFLWRFYWLEEG